MSSMTILPWVLIVVLLSVLGMVYGVSHQAINLSYWAAALFALFVVTTGYMMNRRYWDEQSNTQAGVEQSHDTASNAAADNARLIGTCYVWGSLALMAIYSLTQMKWQHGWQYAADKLKFT